jgi:hypothetical protein
VIGRSRRGSLSIALALAASGVPRAAWGVETAGRPPPAEELVQAAPPPFTDGIFPCSQCHDGGGDPAARARRPLEFHGEVQDRLAHLGSQRWCLDCHDFQDRDALHLSGGERIPFSESYALCGQCHYDKYRDWRLGIHGKRVGRWDGAKTYLLCVHCHDPHAPAVKALVPARGPRPPRETWR